MKRKTNAPDPGCLLPLLFIGAVLFGILIGLEVIHWIERGL